MEQNIETKKQEILDFENKIKKTAQERQSTMLKPILEKIEQIAKKNGYAIVFDKATGNIIYANPKYDISNELLRELEK